MEAGKGSSRTIQPCEIIEIEDDPMDPVPGPSVPIPSQQAQTSQRVCNDKGVEVKMNTQSTQTSEATVLLATGKGSPGAPSAPRKPSLQVSILPPEGQSAGAILTIRTPIEINDGPAGCTTGQSSTAPPPAPMQATIRSTGTSTEAGGASASSATPTAPKQQTAWQRAVNAISIDGVVDFTSLMQEIQPYVNRLPTIKKLMIYKKMLEMVQQEYVNEVKKQCPNTRTDRP